MRPVRLGGPSSYFGDTGGNNNNNNNGNNSFSFDDYNNLDTNTNRTNEHENDPESGFSLVVRRGGARAEGTGTGSNPKRPRRGSSKRRPFAGSQQQLAASGRTDPLVAADDYNDAVENNNNSFNPRGFSIDPSAFRLGGGSAGNTNIPVYLQQQQPPQHHQNAATELAPRMTVPSRGSNLQGSYYSGDTASMLYGARTAGAAGGISSNAVAHSSAGANVQPNQFALFQQPQQIQALPSAIAPNFHRLSQQLQQQQLVQPRPISPLGAQSLQQQQQQQQHGRTLSGGATQPSGGEPQTHLLHQQKAAALDQSSLGREIIRLRHALILAHQKLQANKLDIPPPSDLTMPNVRGLPIQPLAKATHVGVSRYYEGSLEVLEGVDITVPASDMTSSIFGGPEWKKRFVVVNEGGVNVYKNEESVKLYAGQRGLKASLMFQHVTAFVPACGQAGRENSKWTPPHPMALDTEKYRYFGFVRDTGFLMLFRTDQETVWNVWSHAFGRAINPPLYAQTFPDIVAADPDPKIDDVTKLTDEEKKKVAEQEEEDQKLKKKKKQEEEDAEAERKKQEADKEDEKRKIDALLFNSPPSAKAEGALGDSTTATAETRPTSPTSGAAPPPPPPPTSPPPPPPVFPPQLQPRVETQDRGFDPIFPLPKTSVVSLQTEAEEVDTRVFGMQTDAWLPETPIVDPVEVENQWAAHVEQLHQKYGEHTAKLEHNLQLARAEVAQLNSLIEIMKTQQQGDASATAAAATSAVATTRIVPSIPRQGDIIGDDDDDGNDNLYQLHHEQRSRTTAATTAAPDDLSPISTSKNSPMEKVPVVGGTRRSAGRNSNNYHQRSASASMIPKCQNCNRLENEIASVEEERDCLIRELARRHEDYQKGISRLCDQVLDDIDAVHAHMRDRELEHIQEQKKARRNDERRGDDDDDDDNDEADDDDGMSEENRRRQEPGHDDEFDVEKRRRKYTALRQQQQKNHQPDPSSSSSWISISQQEHVALLDQMQQLSKVVPPFVSIQLFDESVHSKNSNTQNQTQHRSASSLMAIGRVGVRAAFDSRICTVETVPGRDTCSWIAKDSKNGKSLCSLKLKLENGATLSQ